MAFQCTIVTPEQQAFDASVSQVILPAYDGQLGVLTGRAPLLAKLGPGTLQVDVTGAGTRYFFVDGGLAQMKDNKLTVLTNEATEAAEVDAESARAEYAEAAARRATDPQAAEDRERQMHRARAKQAVAALK